VKKKAPRAPRTRKAAALVQRWQKLDENSFALADALAHLRDVSGYSQRGLARYVGRTEGAVSKILALLEVDPAVRRMACRDRSGRITRRHLYAVRGLPPREQRNLIQEVLRNGISAMEFEQLVARRSDGRTGRKRRGRRVTRQRFTTSAATVTFAFRKKPVTDSDILRALTEVRAKVRTTATTTREIET
jgi:hypothetical protein